MATIKFFEDYHVGDKVSAGEFELEKSEIIDFAGKWDPQPFHTDEAAAAESVYGGLTASGCHVVAIAMSLVEKSDAKPKVIGALGWDELRFPNPARPGDRLTLTLECIEARPSESKPDRGIVRNQFTLANQNGETVLILKDTILVEKRKI